jgi:hypothetical protein
MMPMIKDELGPNRNPRLMIRLRLSSLTGSGTHIRLKAHKPKSSSCCGKSPRNGRRPWRERDRYLLPSCRLPPLRPPPPKVPPKSQLPLAVSRRLAEALNAARSQ